MNGPAGAVLTGTVANSLVTGDRVNRRYIDWIWRIRGSVPLPPGLPSEEAFERLDPLFRERDTHHTIGGDTLTFSKSNQAPQDKMSVFDGGALRIEAGQGKNAGGPVLRYELTSKILLFCFLAPLLFLAFAGLNLGIGMIDKPTAEEKAEAKKEEEEKEKRYAARPQHPIDKFLGAPAPDKPKTEAEKKKEEAEKKAKGEDEEEDEGPSPTPAYVFAGIFATLYVIGRILEAWLIRSLFRKRLHGDRPSERESPAAG